tara:strand:- start:283 stop:489 length:207 start_codon:yes stop_codon:yes gene_type:complete
MKVFVTHQKDGYGGQCIAAIFSAEALAQEWVIERHYARNAFYAGKPEQELRELANELIETHDVGTPNV